MSEVQIALVSVAIGFVLSLLGSWILDWIRKRSRRRLFLELLGSQLSAIPERSDLDPAILWISTPVTHVTAARVLLSDDILSPRRDIDLIRGLVSWISWEDGYNSITSDLNSVIVGGQIIAEDRIRWDQHRNSVYDGLYAKRSIILKDLTKRKVNFVPEEQWIRPSPTVS